ncbi:LCP family protein [Vagococcus sp.]|uniref:LCP family protein n=1 Tax=Vagococcus sp. TaxID=1933889 RepID=UPI003F9A32DE
MTQMTRMDRHKQTKEAEKVETVEPRVSQNKKPLKPPKNKKKKKKRKGILFYFLLLLFLLMVGSGIGYAKGFFSAKADKANQPQEVTDFKGQASQDGSINILLLGSDSRGADQGRADTIMIAHYNKKDKTPKLVSVMRDTYLPIPMGGQDNVEFNKVNAAYAYGGAERMRETLSYSFGIPIQYYAVVNFDTFPKFVDILSPGGIAINAEKTLDVEGTTIQKGEQKLNGHQALQYARFRKDEEGDFGRVRRQQQVMNALVKSAFNPKNVWRIPEVLGAVNGYTETNLPMTTAPSSALSYTFSKHRPLEILTVPVKGSYWDNYYDGAGSVLEIDQAVNKAAIDAFLKK